MEQESSNSRQKRCGMGCSHPMQICVRNSGAVCEKSASDMQYSPPPPPHSNPRRKERNSYFDYRITSAQFAAAIWFIYLLFPFSRKKGPFYRVGQLRFLACKKKKKTGPALRQLSFGTAELKNGRYTGKMGARRSLVDMRDTFLQS